MSQSQSRSLRPCDDILTLIGNKVSALRDKAYHEDRITFKGAWCNSWGLGRKYHASITLRVSDYKKLNWSCGRVSWVEQQHRNLITELNDINQRYASLLRVNPIIQAALRASFPHAPFVPDHLLPSHIKVLITVLETDSDDDSDSDSDEDIDLWELMMNN